MQQLTQRQAQVVDLFVLRGLTHRQTAARLGLSHQTINPHLKAAARKLGCGRSISREAMLAALERQ